MKVEKIVITLKITFKFGRLILKDFKCWDKLYEAFKNTKNIKTISATSCSCSYVKSMLNRVYLRLCFSTQMSSVDSFRFRFVCPM